MTGPSMPPQPRASDPTRAAYDLVAEEYARQFADELDGKPLDRAFLVAFAEQVPVGAPVADVGCGPGHVAAFLTACGTPTVGVDLSPGMVAEARRRFPDLDVRVASALDLPFEDAELGGLVAFYVLIHLDADERRRAYGEFARVVRPGGAVLLAFHVGEEVRHLESWFGHEVDLDFRFLRPADVTADLAAAGFQVRALLRRRAYPGEVDTERGYVVAHRSG